MSWFLHPLGLLALTSVPAVLALHLFRRRFSPHVVSAVFLWVSRDRAPVSGRKLDRLYQNPSFWLEIFAALLLALAFAGLRLPWTQDAEHLVVVLDGSASMSAVSSGESSAERAVAKVHGRMDVLPRRSRVTVVESGTPPHVIAGPAAFPEQARDALSRFAPRASVHDLGPALSLARQLADGGSVMLLTDRFEPQSHAGDVDLVAVGEPAGNVGITHTARAPAGGQQTSTDHSVFLTVTNFSAREATTPIELGTAGSMLHRRELTLAGGERKHLSFTIPATTPLLVARLGDDALQVDNVAYLAAPPPRTVSLATTFDDVECRALGLAGPSSRIENWLNLAPHTVQSDPATAHLVLGPAAIESSRAWCLVLSAPGENRSDLIGPFLAEKRHPLVGGLTLQGIVWSADPDLQLPGAPLISAGNLLLLTEASSGGRMVFSANFDSTRSSLQRSPDWPILLSNLIEHRRSSLPGPERTNVVFGQPFRYRGTAPTDYVVEGHAGEREIHARSTLWFDEFESPGQYLLHALDPEGNRQRLCEIGVSFISAPESDLQTLGSGSQPSPLAAARLSTDFTWMEVLVLTVALTLLVLDWLYLKKNTASLELRSDSPAGQVRPVSSTIAGG